MFCYRFATLVTGIVTLVTSQVVCGQSSDQIGHVSLYRPNYFSLNQELDTKFNVSTMFVIVPPVSLGVMNTSLYGTMSFKAWWRTGTSESKSFEEIDFNPSAFCHINRTFMISHPIGNAIIPVRLDLGVEHESTGDVKSPDADFGRIVDNNTNEVLIDFGSRGWNRWFMEAKWMISFNAKRIKYIEFSARPWLRFDVEEQWMPSSGYYLGDSEYTVVIKTEEVRFSTVLRWSNQKSDHLVSAEHSVFVDIPALSPHIYIQVWQGYGEQLRMYSKQKRFIPRFGLAFLND